MSDLLVLGDSVPWGQGLLDEHKFTSLVAKQLGQTADPVNVKMYAHSGATIGVNDPSTKNPKPGEVPFSYPTIMQQLQASSSNVPAAKWIIVNGGINDVNIRCILNPLYSQADLDSDTALYCDDQMTWLLKVLGSSFPQAPVYVVGYYPILSYQSDPLGIDAIYAAHMASEWTALADRKLLRNAVVDHCLRFWKYSTQCLQAAVQHANSYHGTNRFVFVDTGFSEANAAFAPQKLLWGVNTAPGQLFGPEDEVIALRKTECDSSCDVLDLFTCYRASAGHPDVAGAEEIAKQIPAAV